MILLLLLQFDEFLLLQDCGVVLEAVRQDGWPCSTRTRTSSERTAARSPVSPRGSRLAPGGCLLPTDVLQFGTIQRRWAWPLRKNDAHEKAQTRPNTISSNFGEQQTRGNNRKQQNTQPRGRPRGRAPGRVALQYAHEDFRTARSSERTAARPVGPCGSRLAPGHVCYARMVCELERYIQSRNSSNRNNKR